MVRVLACILALFLPIGATVALAQPTGRSTVIQPVITIANNTLWQVILPAGNRQSITIQNNNTVDTCWIYLGADTATKQRAILLLAGGSYTRYYPFIPNDTIQGICATNGSTIYVDVTGP